MEVDTGATLSIIGHKTYQQLWTKNAPPLKPIQAHLRTYTGEAIKTLGEVDVEVNLDKQTKQLILLIVDGDGPTLLGWDWLTRSTRTGHNCTKYAQHVN